MLETLTGNAEELEKRNIETGRKTDPKGSCAVSKEMFDLYSSLGCTTDWLDVLPPAQRLDLLLRECGLPHAKGEPTPSRTSGS